LFNSKLNGQKLGLNTPLRTASLNSEFIVFFKVYVDEFVTKVLQYCLNEWI